MRLMLGCSKETPSLLVEVKSSYDPTNFEFLVVNGKWRGRLINNQVYVDGTNDIFDDKVFILCSDQNVLSNRYDYNEVFETFRKWVRGEE